MPKAQQYRIAKLGRMSESSPSSSRSRTKRRSRDMVSVDAEEFSYPVYQTEEDVPFVSLGVIGHGSYAFVEKVTRKQPQAKPLNPPYFAARKAIDIRMDDEVRILREIQKEVKVIQTLSHKHIIHLITSYRYLNQFSIVMQPVADCNLQTFLQDPSRTGLSVDPIRRLELLKRWPGCLLRAIHYIYSQGVRHTDIKPANLLVHGDDIVIADFGIAKEVLERGSTGSTGTPGPRTRMYRSPEATVIYQARRGRSEDIFSLGCVFLEIATVLFGVPLTSFTQFRVSKDGNHAYAENPDKLLRWIWYLWAIWDSFTPDTTIHYLSVAVCELAFFMLEPDYRIRITSAQLLRLVADEDDHYRGLRWNCCDECNHSWDEAVGGLDGGTRNGPTYATFKETDEVLKEMKHKRPPEESLNQAIVGNWETAKRKWLERHLHWGSGSTD
jgi:serine/threonine protein kinase